jgi:predicted metal-binding membrane protein
MTILLVGGVMDLGLMAAIAAAITLERLAPWPRLSARAIGVVAVAVGVVLLARALVPMS